MQTTLEHEFSNKIGKGVENGQGLRSGNIIVYCRSDVMHFFIQLLSYIVTTVSIFVSIVALYLTLTTKKVLRR